MATLEDLQEEIKELRNLVVTVLANKLDGIKDQLSDFNGTVIGLAHDVENLEEKADDHKVTKAEVWEQINSLKTDLGNLRVRAGGSNVKTDLIWKILVALATAASIAALLGG